MDLELFHATNDADSAVARREVAAHPLQRRIRFRNVFYPEVTTDLRGRGGSQVPALWDGQRLVEGLEAVLSALRTLASSGESGA